MKKAQYKEYTEVLAILNIMEKKYKEKVPQKLIKFLEKNRDKSYKFKVDASVPLKEQKINSKALALLAMINLNYWCETEEEKKRLAEIYSENDKKYKEESRMKYNLSNVLNRNSENSVALLEKRESFFERIIKKIKKIWNG